MLKWKALNLRGIPQGSVIGPILFAIFVNDMMPKVVVLNFIKLFSGDCQLYGTVNRAVNWRMVLTNGSCLSNESKCKVLHIEHNNEKRDYTMNDHHLEAVRSERDLGVIDDDELKFHRHTATATKKANQNLGIIKKSYQTRDAVTISTLYKAMVRPHLEYANSIWEPFYKGDIKKAEAVQHRATKLILELKDKSYEGRLKALQPPSLTYYRKRGDMIQMYKIMNKLVRIDAEKRFTRAKAASTCGHSQRVFKTHAKNNARQFWNGLSQHVVSVSTINEFKNRLDKFCSGIIYETDWSTIGATSSLHWQALPLFWWK